MTKDPEILEEISTKLEYCPYRAICPNLAKDKGGKCPGDDRDEGDWVPMLGFKSEPSGVVCLDWDTLITSDSLLELMKSEGWVTSDPGNIDKVDADYREMLKQKRYLWQSKYQRSEKGKETTKRHRQTEKYKLTQQKYHYSEKGQSGRRKHLDRLKAIREAENWCKAHPGKKVSDYFIEKGKPLPF